MTGKMIKNWLENRGDNYCMETSNPNLCIEFEFYESDEYGNYIKPEERTEFDRVDIFHLPSGSIYQVVKRNDEDISHLLERVARKYNNLLRLYKENK